MAFSASCSESRQPRFCIVRERTLPFALHVAGFSEEEGVRYQPYLSSRAVAGTFDPALLELRDAGRQKPSVRQSPTSASIPSRYPMRRTLPVAFERMWKSISSRARAWKRPISRLPPSMPSPGKAACSCAYAGKSGHAGTCPMPLRHDALAGAAELILAVESLARRTEDMVATVGFVQVTPNISNVIADDVELSVEIRHKDDTVRLAAFHEHASHRR